MVGFLQYYNSYFKPQDSGISQKIKLLHKKYCILVISQYNSTSLGLIIIGRISLWEVPHTWVRSCFGFGFTKPKLLGLKKSYRNSPKTDPAKYLHNAIISPRFIKFQPQWGRIRLRLHNIIIWSLTV